MVSTLVIFWDWLAKHLSEMALVQLVPLSGTDVDKMSSSDVHLCDDTAFFIGPSPQIL